MFESKGARKMREWAIGKVARQRISYKTLKTLKLVISLAKLKKRINANTINQDELLVQILPAPSPSKNICHKLVQMVEEGEDKEELLFSCNMIVVDIDF